jgi:hypothetical protein
MANVNGKEDVLKKLQGMVDARSKVGEFARGKNMYPGGSQARTGGGPDIGRPPTGVNAAALQAVQDRIAQTPNANASPRAQQAVDVARSRQMQDSQAQANAVTPGSIVNANPAGENRARLQNKMMQAAAQRRLTSGLGKKRGLQKR